ncbi:MAG: hypothetical protein CM15mV116_020 [uncultured marine virus]|nr:MAG: hypothetical protein CM15mV116_020 [uncultured marine virus]
MANTHFEQELLEMLKARLTKLTGIKTFYLTNTHKFHKSPLDILNGFEKEIYNLEDLQRKLRLINFKKFTLQSNTFKNKTIYNY